MTSYLEVQGLFNLLHAANRMQTEGETLRDELAQLMSTIEAAEQDPGTFPPDEFSLEFLKHYEGTQEGTDLPANQAVRAFIAGGSGEGELGLGGTLGEFGSVAANAMWTYSATDDGGADDIHSVES